MGFSRLIDLFEGASPRSGFPALDAFGQVASPRIFCDNVKEIVDGTVGVPGRVIDYFDSLTAEEIKLVIDRSAEKPTHYKWFLGGRGESYRVWLHQYKEPAEFAKVGGYASSIHNHRYSFVSRMLTGGYLVDDFHLHKNGRLYLGNRVSITPEHCSRIVRSTDIHQINQVRENTYTLVVQGPVERNTSKVWDSLNCVAREIPDLVRNFDVMSDELRHLV